MKAYRRPRQLLLAAALLLVGALAQEILLDPDQVAGKDFYGVLGVPQNASEKQIREAYRKLAREHHPDKNPDRKEAANARFTEVGEAYEVLRNAEARREYDHIHAAYHHANSRQRHHHQDGNQGRTGGGFAGFRDASFFASFDPFALFEEFFAPTGAPPYHDGRRHHAAGAHNPNDYAMPHFGWDTPHPPPPPPHPGGYDPYGSAWEGAGGGSDHWHQHHQQQQTPEGATRPQLVAGESMRVGERLESPGGSHYAQLGLDCSLAVLRRGGGAGGRRGDSVVWETGGVELDGAASANCHLVLQANGNLVVMRGREPRKGGGRYVLWSSNTATGAAAQRRQAERWSLEEPSLYAAVGEDGSLEVAEMVFADESLCLWSSYGCPGDGLNMGALWRAVKHTSANLYCNIVGCSHDFDESEAGEGSGGVHVLLRRLQQATAAAWERLKRVLPKEAPRGDKPR